MPHSLITIKPRVEKCGTAWVAIIAGRRYFHRTWHQAIGHALSNIAPIDR